MSERVLEDCPECHGDGHDSDGIECETCDGKGHVEVER